MAAKLCNVCGKRRGQTGTKGSETSPYADMCNYCFEEGGYENQHSDAAHAAILAEVEDNKGSTTTLSKVDKAEYEGFMPECWICHPELNLAQVEKATSKGTSGPRNQGTRRPQFNHKGHHHPQTPAARRTCKNNFWFAVKTSGTTDEALIGQLMAEWDAWLDGNGKPIPTEQALAAKPASWTVVPLGPKGGVLNQMAKGSPAKGKFLTKAEGKKLYGK